MRNSLLSFLFVGLAACSVEAPDTVGTGEDRGSLGKADVVGSCIHKGKELCGGKGKGNCWCDDACVDFGDCCPDAPEVCGLQEPEPEGDACGGLLGLTCDDGEFCMYSEDAMCGAADHLGECAEVPEFCIEIFAPVCACDGNTYGNSCFAHAAGTSVVHEGECESEPEFCGGFAGIQCPDGEVCVDDPDDDCDPEHGGADCGGICVDGPECQPVLCELFCEHGFQTDEDGCEVCSCNPPPAEDECHTAGCSGELCVGPDGPDFSICIFQAWYVCLDLSTCGNFGPSGSCGWDPNPEYLECLTSFGQ
jgi:hypothetical protein